MTWLIFVLGALPFLGLAVRGTFPQGELGLATVLVLFAIRQLLLERRGKDEEPVQEGRRPFWPTGSRSRLIDRQLAADRPRRGGFPSPLA
jgi:hypothetical protein